jgi:RNA polymerase sigma factor (sigma-70 family)
MLGVKPDPDREPQFISLLEAHRALLYKIARIYGHSAADRDDLAQEAIANLWRAFPRYDSQLRFSTWMYRVCLNVAISWQRHERTQTRHLVAVDEAVLENLRDLRDPPESEDVTLLYTIIGKFDQLDKALLLLYLDGQSHQEISAVLGITTTNVATRIGRLKERLRAEFRAAGHL